MSAAPAAGSPTNVCPQCGVQFRCGMAAGDKECWCASLPPLLPLPTNADSGAPVANCFCPACLEAKLGCGPQEATLGAMAVASQPG